MPRPKHKRKVHAPPLYSVFKPVGLRARNLKQVVLTLDEFEAIRLADQEGYTHEMAAEEMKISRTTFTRLIEKARKNLADFIINGHQLTIEGGAIHFKVNILQCLECNYTTQYSMETDIKECPVCHSSRITNLAGNFGHGHCCI